MYAIRSYYEFKTAAKTNAEPMKATGICQDVITSYSIHYTKLYDAHKAGILRFAYRTKATYKPKTGSYNFV